MQSICVCNTLVEISRRQEWVDSSLTQTMQELMMAGDFCPSLRVSYVIQGRPRDVTPKEESSKGKWLYQYIGHHLQSGCVLLDLWINIFLIAFSSSLIPCAGGARISCNFGFSFENKGRWPCWTCSVLGEKRIRTSRFSCPHMRTNWTKKKLGNEWWRKKKGKLFFFFFICRPFRSGNFFNKQISK